MFKFTGWFNIVWQAGGDVTDLITPEQQQGVQSSVPSDAQGLYQPVDFCIPVGPIFNFVTGGNTACCLFD